MSDRPLIHLRPACDADEAFLLFLYRSTREAELSLTGWAEPTRDAFVRMQFDAQCRDYTARFPDAEQSIIIIDGADAGRVCLHRSADEWRLLDITVAPGCRGRGIGTAVMQAMQAEAASAGVPLRHTVFAGNLDAIRFYQRLGFVLLSQDSVYLLMEWLPNFATAGAPG